MSAPVTLAVEVTDSDILAGKPQDNCLCPVALALKRLPGVTDVWVEFEYATVTFAGDDETERNYVLPPAAESFITGFDRGDPVGPVAFTAEQLPEES